MFTDQGSSLRLISLNRNLLTTLPWVNTPVLGIQRAPYFDQLKGQQTFIQPSSRWRCAARLKSDGGENCERRETPSGQCLDSTRVVLDCSTLGGILNGDIDTFVVEVAYRKWSDWHLERQPHITNCILNDTYLNGSVGIYFILSLTQSGICCLLKLGLDLCCYVICSYIYSPHIRGHHYATLLQSLHLHEKRFDLESTF